jgi:anti-anti-sigma factor
MIAVSRHATWTIIDLNGPLNPRAITALDRLLDDLAESGGGDLVIDLSDVDYLETSRLQTLINALDRARRHGHEIITVTGSSAISCALAACGVSPLPTYNVDQRTH